MSLISSTASLEIVPPTTSETRDTAAVSPVTTLVGRFAGLSAEAIEPFGSQAAATSLLARDAVAKELAEVRAKVVVLLSEALTRFDVETRRLLLAIKRTCYNGQNIGPFRTKAHWPAFLEISGTDGGRLIALEGELESLERDFEAVYARELIRERLCLLNLLEIQSFSRGVAIGRRGLVEKARSRARTLKAHGVLRSPEKWENSLLRFATRAATKLSAKSTLTTYSQGIVGPSSADRGMHVSAEPTREVSLVRLDRPQLEQLQALLLRHPAVRAHALIAWNDTIQELGPDRFSFLRDGYWDLAPEADCFRFEIPVKVKATLPHQLLHCLKRLLSQGAIRFSELPTALELGGASAYTEKNDGPPPNVDDLLRLGVLILLPPWPTHEPWLEERISRFLASIAEQEPEIRGIATKAADLVTLEKSFSSAAQPEDRVIVLEASFSGLIADAARLTGHQGRLSTSATFFEDVLLEPSNGAHGAGGTFHVSASTVKEIHETVSLIWRFDGLFQIRHDILHTLAAWWRTHLPNHRRASFNEVATGFAPLWSLYLKFLEGSDTQQATFAPLPSPKLARLQELRNGLMEKTRKLVARCPTKDFLSNLDLHEIVDELPVRYGPMTGPAVFVQPTDTGGTSWVLNNITPGIGRYSSRIVPVLEELPREKLLRHFISRSVIKLDGEEADLLEVKYPFVHLLRAHPPQAARVLDYRGVNLDLPPERRVGLDELHLEADLENETFRLVDRAGRRVLPASLDTLPEAGLPNRLRFLLMLGPGETRGVFPFPWCEGDDHVKVFHRLTCGHMVLRRRTWKIAMAGFREILAATPSHQAFGSVNGWRRELGLPREVYYNGLMERGRMKPQLVRFDSPSLCRIFVASLQKLAENSPLYVVEALPSPTEYPLDTFHERRACELLIDSFLLPQLDGTIRETITNMRDSLSERTNHV